MVGGLSFSLEILSTLNLRYLQSEIPKVFPSFRSTLKSRACLDSDFVCSSSSSDGTFSQSYFSARYLYDLAIHSSILS